MDVHFNREIKAYCPDFVPVRALLHDFGATFVEVKEQVDYYYHLPASGDGDGTPRLKLRVEGEQRQLIYYYERHETDARISQFQLWEIGDPQITEVLDVALGNRVVVRKQRELWRRENIKFNLDTVEDVGQIFEVEAQEVDGHDVVAQVEECHRRFGLYLGSRIAGSNEDLLAAPEGSFTAGTAVRLQD